MMDKLTRKSQEALQAAQELARARSHQELDGHTWHWRWYGRGTRLYPRCSGRRWIFGLGDGFKCGAGPACGWGRRERQ